VTSSHFLSIKGLLSINSIWLVLKFLFCFAILLYTIFTFVVIRQVEMMLQVLSGQLEIFLRFISRLYFLAAVFTLLAAIFFL